MQVVPVEPGPAPPAYDNFEGAIVGALTDSLQPKAKTDTAKLLGTQITDTYWTDTECVIRFSNDLLIHIRVDNGAVNWDVTGEPPTLDPAKVERVGAPAVLTRWPDNIEHIWHRSAMAAKRLGSEFQQLFVTSGALLVYCRGQLIWWFHAVHRLDDGRLLLFTAEDD
jgi:hypothetical protein